MKSFIMFVFSVFVLSVGSLNAFPSMKPGEPVLEGKIKIKVVKNIGDGKVQSVKGKTVILSSFQMNEKGSIGSEVLTGKKKTDVNGEVDFNALDMNLSKFYIAKVFEDDKPFKSGILSFRETGSIEETITLYDVSESDEGIRIFKKHTIIDGASGEKGERLIFKDVLIIENGSSKGYFPPKNAGLKINIPKGVENLNFIFGASPDDITYVEGEDFFKLHTPVMPGHSNMVSLGTTYEIPLKNGRAKLELSNSYPVVSTVILNSLPDYSIIGDKVKEHGEKGFSDKVYSHYEIDNINKGESVTISIKKKGTGLVHGKLLLFAFLLIVAGFAVFAAFKWKKN